MVSDQNHIYCCVWWLICINVMVLFMSTNETIHDGKNRALQHVKIMGVITMPNILFRKFFHIMAVIMFAYPTLYYVCFFNICD